MRDCSPKLSDKEREEREEFAVEASYLLRDRIRAADLWEPLDLPVAGCEASVRCYWLRAERSFWGGQDPLDERQAVRHQLAYYLLVSLEFLIAADIIDTIVQPSLEELAILGGIIEIRTVISSSPNWELKSGDG